MALTQLNCWHKTHKQAKDSTDTSSRGIMFNLDHVKCSSLFFLVHNSTKNSVCSQKLHNSFSFKMKGTRVCSDYFLMSIFIRKYQLRKAFSMSYPIIQLSSALSGSKGFIICKYSKNNLHIAKLIIEILLQFLSSKKPKSNHKRNIFPVFKYTLRILECWN